MQLHSVTCVGAFMRACTCVSLRMCPAKKEPQLLKLRPVLCADNLSVGDKPEGTLETTLSPSLVSKGRVYKHALCGVSL